MTWNAGVRATSEPRLGITRRRGAAYLVSAILLVIIGSSVFIGSSWQLFASGEQWQGFFLGWWMFGMVPAIAIAALCVAWWTIAARTRPTRALLILIVIVSAAGILAALCLGGAWGAGMIASQANPRVMPCVRLLPGRDASRYFEVS